MGRKISTKLKILSKTNKREDAPQHTTATYKSKNVSIVSSVHIASNSQISV